MPQSVDYQKLASQVLGVDTSASKPEIQNGYYRMMTMYHPDKNRDDPNVYLIHILLVCDGEQQCFSPEEVQ